MPEIPQLRGDEGAESEVDAPRGGHAQVAHREGRLLLACWEGVARQRPDDVDDVRVARFNLRRARRSAPEAVTQLCELQAHLLCVLGEGRPADSPD